MTAPGRFSRPPNWSRGDIVKLSLGTVVAADVRIREGSILLDQSMLTGESLPVEAGPGTETYAGALVRRGEAVAEVLATGVRTKFGRTAELVRTAYVVSTQQKAVFRVVRNLAGFNGAVTALLMVYAYEIGMPLSEAIPLVLISVLASVPVALPATFTLATAIGARALDTGRRASDPSLGGRRSREPRCPVHRQDRHLDAQRTRRGRRTRDARLR